MKRNVSVVLAGLLTVVVSVGSVRAESPVQLDEIIVTAPVTTSEGDVITPVPDVSAATINAAELAAQIPGVATSHRGANAAEPVVRGLGWERVVTQLGCHPLYGACPSRMDPPATYVSPLALQSVRVVKGVPSVTLGPGGTGGRLILNTDYDRGAGAEAEYSGLADVTWNEGRDGFIAGLAIEGGTEDVDLRASASAAQLNDYTSGGDIKVPAGLDERDVSLSLGWRPTDESRLFGHVQYKEEEDVEFPSLPMDVKTSDSTIVTLGYRTEEQGGRFERIEVNAGYSFVDHVMNNENKSNRKKMEAETPSEATSFSGKMDLDWRWTENAVFTFGLDGERLERDATRTRTMTATGKTFTDHIWPDVERDILGAFGELNWDASDRMTLRIGGRIDRVNSDAGAVDDTIVLAPGNAAPIRDRYVEYNGEGADDVDLEETLFSGNVLTEWQLNEAWYTYAGIGRTERFPGVTELYFAFSPAPGGYQVGNPSLDTEKKTEISTGIGYEGKKVKSEVSVFAANVDDYILQTSLSKFDLNGDGRGDNLRGFRNVDAELYGCEASVEVRVSENWQVPVSLAYVRGKNTTDNRDLPEIPPLSGSASIRYIQDSAHSWWLETGLRFSARQDKIDPEFAEDETPSFTVFHVRGGIELLDNLDLEVGVENLFDEDYNEHLTREVALADDSLDAGDEVPAPGRYVYVKASCTF